MAPRSEAHAAYGHALRHIRTERGLSQERVAHLADLDRSYVSGIERGERHPSLANILKLTAVLGVNVSELAARAEELMSEGRGRTETI